MPGLCHGNAESLTLVTSLGSRNSKSSPISGLVHRTAASAPSSLWQNSQHLAFLQKQDLGFMLDFAAGLKERCFPSEER